MIRLIPRPEIFNLLLALALFSLLATGLWGCSTTEPPDLQTPQPAEVAEPLPYPEESDLTLGRKLEDRTDLDVDSLLEQMSLREKIGQLFYIRVHGTFTNRSDERFLRWRELIEEYHIGGLIFMQGDIYGQALMTQKLQELSQLPLWIIQDMEYGAAMRVSGTTRFTPAMGVAATGRAENAYRKGEITAREAKALGVHQILAPVLDVNNNPENPVINVRSFSSNPEVVARFAESFIQGVQSEGLLATPKHFPGHGDTDVDSHLALPTIPHDYARMDTLELYPFRHVIGRGVRSIMSAHISFPALSRFPDRPATLDPDILTGLLADTLGFDGLVVTDGLEMRGITEFYSPGEAAVLALEAGSDALILSTDEKTAIHELELAVNNGRISEDRINRSVRKILELKKEFGLFEKAGPDPDDLSLRIRTPQYRAEAGRIARESVTLLKNRNQILPIREDLYRRIVVISIADDDSGQTGSSLAREIRRYHPNVGFHVFDQRTGSEEREKMFEDARNADLLIVGSFIFVRSHQPMQLTDEQQEFLDKLKDIEQPVALISFGNPYMIRELENADVHLLSWAATTKQVRNTVPALFGGSPITGKLPISIPGIYEFGHGIELPHSGIRFDEPESVGLRTDSLMNVDRIMQRAVEDSVFPGGVVAVLKDGVIAWQRGYGYHDYQRTRPVRPDDVYDLASITKVFSTTTAIMKLVDDGKLSLDDPVSRYLPEFDQPTRDQITVRHLLLHTSGLPAFRVYVDELRTREELLAAIRNEPLIHEPGEEYIYSDLGFILLGELVEAVSGQRIDHYLQEKFLNPMGLRTTGYNPSSRGRWFVSRIPPTEVDTVYSRGMVHGEVHDERAYFMNGVSTHAGLFSAADDLARWAQMILNGGHFLGQQFIQPETVRLFTSHRSPINVRGYGFDRKSGDNSLAGRYTSDRTFGHLGFTGTSIWIDPDSRIAIILLTNRTWPNRNHSSGIGDVRRSVSDAVMQSIRE